MPILRDAFIQGLCNFTHLHSPATMRFKNALAFKALLRVTDATGDHLQDRWVHGLVMYVAPHGAGCFYAGDFN